MESVRNFKDSKIVKLILLFIKTIKIRMENLSIVTMRKLTIAQVQ